MLANDGEDEIGELLLDNRAVLGLSDAGAHASQICDACFSTHLLGHWVRELGRDLARAGACAASPRTPPTCSASPIGA